MDRQIACLHIPSFGITLARTENAALRNRPVAVAPVHTPRALIREVSVEASGAGLQPGMSVELARLICPDLRVVPPDSSRMEAAHRELQQRVRSFAPVWESIRPGALFLDFTGTSRLFGPPIDTAARIGRELTRQHEWRSMIGLANEFDCSYWSIRSWLRQAERDGGQGDGGLTSPERKELTRLRRENRRLKMERDILAKAAAWFAQESTPNSTSSSDS